MEAKEYAILQVERTRGQLRADAFLRMGKHSLELRGKTLPELVADLQTVGKKPIELVDAAALSDVDGESQPGDIVSVGNAFESNEGMIWEGTDIRFKTASGAVVSPDQYEYLRQQELGPAKIFAEAREQDQGVKVAWRAVTRIAREARNDKAKEIFYITLGALIWTPDPGKKNAKRVTSPLFIMQIREESTAAGLYKFKIVQPTLKQNSVLRRDVLKQTGVNIYEGCGEDISLQDVETALARIGETVEGYLNGMKVDTEQFHLCILDSHDEGMCQVVEKNLDTIAASKLTKMMSGELTAAEVEGSCEPGPAPILPLPADESQKRVVEAVLSGKSIYSPAPAGAGKSQTSVNIAANLAIRGKPVCIMSEKVAANEVFLKYAAYIGLDKYCLSIDSNMKTADIVRQIKSIAKIGRRYVQADLAKETVQRYNEAIQDYERLNGSLFQRDPVLGISLYELLSLAVRAPAVEALRLDHLKKRDLAWLKEALTEIDHLCFEIMTDSEFEDFFHGDACEDPELRAMLEKCLERFSEKGIDLRETVREGHLSRTDVVTVVLANAAGKLALDIIGEKDLYEVGNRRVKAVYKTLVDRHLQMQELYVSYLHQELSARIVDNRDDMFVAGLDKLKANKVTPQELFAVYGKEILSICPIVITTPTAAANYLYGTGMDSFHAMIIDEASQMKIISLLPYTDRIEQLVVFGDPMQLGITSTFMKKDLVDAEAALRDTALSDRSVLQAVQGRFPIYGLGYHYRSGTEMLIHISNKTCYDGALETIPDVYTTRAALPAYLGLELIRVDPPSVDKPGCNQNEACEIATRVQELRQKYPARSIGIIAFNERQQDTISDMLEETLGGYVDSDRLWVRSLENAQGKEADFVFISIGHYRRNQNGSLHLNISELNREGGENRLNVLFTRARCKNFILVSFDHRELKRSDNSGVKRLYEYLEYAANGELNESSVSRAGNADHAMVRQMAHVLEELDPTFKTKDRIGTENMTVDIAVKKNGDPRYALGILMPSFRQTPQEAVTKITVLERAGWHVSPVSPIYFLTAKKTFKSQIKKDIREPIAFTKRDTVCFDTDRRPDVLFCAEDLTVIDPADVVQSVTCLTRDDLRAMDLIACYREHLREELWTLDIEVLKAIAQNGDTEAELAYLIRIKDAAVDAGKERSLRFKVNRLYTQRNEKRACFYLAQLLRTEDMSRSMDLIEDLIKRANKLGIGGD